jgi:hypothetical protein
VASETRQDAILGLMDAGVGSAPTVDTAAVLASHEPLWHAGFRRGDDPALCDKCRCKWRGSAATGGCEAVLLARRVAQLEAALAKWDRWVNPPFVPGASWPVGEE